MGEARYEAKTGEAGASTCPWDRTTSVFSPLSGGRACLHHEVVPISSLFGGNMNRLPLSALAVSLAIVSSLPAIDAAGVKAAFDKSRSTKKPLLVVVGDHG